MSWAVSWARMSISAHWYSRGPFAPAPAEQSGGEPVDALLTGGGAYPVVAGHGQHVADPPGLQLGAQIAVGAVDLVGGHPRCRCPGVQRPVDHLCGQLGFGGEPHVVGDAGGGEPGGG